MSTEIKIKTPYIELDSLLKFASVVSTGGEAKIIIKNGEVLVNGTVCIMRKKKIFPGDSVSFEENTLTVVG